MPTLTSTQRLLLAGRAIVAVAIATAVIGQLATSLTFWTARGDADIGLNVLNFFSFFTIESNLLAMVTLAVLVVLGLRRRALGRGLQVLLLCATTYMVVTGIVYNTLLRGIELPQGATLGWSNEILHLIAPLWMLVDWLLSARERDVRWRDTAIVAIYPVAWLACTMLRGPVTLDQAAGDGTWYPYPFLDPASHANGYVGVVIICVVIAATIVVAAAALIAIARARRRGGAAAPQPDATLPGMT